MEHCVLSQVFLGDKLQVGVVQLLKTMLKRQDTPFPQCFEVAFLIK